MRGASGGPLVNEVIAAPFDAYRDGATPYAGSVPCGFVTGPAGAVVPDRFWGDLPDGWDYTGTGAPSTDGSRFLFPGDVIHYYITATDTAGSRRTLRALTRSG